MSENMNVTAVSTTENEYLEALNAAAFYDFAAEMLLTPLPAPGHNEIVGVASRVRLLFGEAAHDEDALPGVREWVAWCKQVENADAQADEGEPEALEALQRETAVDRTRLSRGVDEAGPLPPYETYWLSSPDGDGASSQGRLSGIADAYAQANVHFGGEHAERDDFLGVELAFLAHLAHRELTALEIGDTTAALTARTQRETFEREHLFTWLSTWCTSATPHATSTFFPPFLTLLKTWATPEETNSTPN
ncbi:MULTISPECIES: TorD/DmsD family molecular chaperone [Gordonibacter]|uniref:Molecular chaperone TorD family protein n=1 Tax=Gordonibacter faecis TaxID=3047475 RepID=A0ABT7DPC3_9ACTN|nr:MULTISPECIES: molecular chaperone TorD family protein [unclassified Gordonibacter]MDJ1650000.1 molecular chaperone TorD family protein [Gordonibacter sp. KGMB12511]HIW76680.1 molecular chaperone TorD family protein [Candidatus Gordonibacter avicola]